MDLIEDRKGDRTSNCSETSQMEVAGTGEILDVFREGKCAVKDNA